MSLEFDLSKLSKKLSELEKKASKQIAKKTLLAGADPMEKALVDSAPMDTGELKRNIKSAKNITTKKGNSTIDVGVTKKEGAAQRIIDRAYYQHYGSRSRAGTYWMDEGFRKGIEPAKEKMVEVLREELK